MVENRARCAPEPADRGRLLTATTAVFAVESRASPEFANCSPLTQRIKAAMSSGRGRRMIRVAIDGMLARSILIPTILRRRAPALETISTAIRARDLGQDGDGESSLYPFKGSPADGGTGRAHQPYRRQLIYARLTRRSSRAGPAGTAIRLFDFRPGRGNRSRQRGARRVELEPVTWELNRGIADYVRVQPRRRGLRNRALAGCGGSRGRLNGLVLDVRKNRRLARRGGCDQTCSSAKGDRLARGRNAVTPLL